MVAGGLQRAYAVGVAFGLAIAERAPQEAQEPPADDLTRYDETVAQMADPERYKALRALTFEERHECPVDGCRLSAEEHHRLAFGMIAELAELRRRVRDFENGSAS